jgi:hypothetical protein
VCRGDGDGDSLAVEIVKRSDKAKGFEVLPMCWVVERGHFCGSPPSA